MSAEKGLTVPGSTVIALFVTLGLLLPAVAWRLGDTLESEEAILEGDLHAPDGRFDASWTLAGSRLRVSEGEGEDRSIGTCTVSIEGDSGDAITTHFERNGTISDVFFLDPDGDGDSDVIVWITSAGSGSYAQVMGCHFDGSQWQLTDMTEIPAPLDIGYMGHDTLSRTVELLRRSFPIYRQRDTNASPTGIEKVLLYNFITGSWNLDPTQY